MAKWLKLNATYTFTTSPNLCHHITLLITDVPNCHITLEFITIRLLRYVSKSTEGDIWESFMKCVILNINTQNSRQPFAVDTLLLY